jgi:peptidoglycan/LPS O-acetylase OafA/YrhL
MFFVISGYCIGVSASVSLARGDTARQFLGRRLRRICPTYWCSLVVVATLPFVVEGLSAMKTGHYVQPSADVLNYGFLRYGVLDWLRVASLTQIFADVPGATSLQYKFTTINAVYWTLAIEVQFYLVMTIAVWARRRAFLFIAALTAISLMTAQQQRLYLTGVFLPYWPMFAVGLLLQQLIQRGWTPIRLFGRSAPLTCGLIALTGCVAFVSSVLRHYSPSHHVFAVCFAAMLFVAYGFDAVAAMSAVSRVRIVRLAAMCLTAVGGASYSIYLLHGRLQFLCSQVVSQVLVRNSVANDAAVIAATVAGCLVFYLYCERPFITVKKTKSQPVKPEGALTISA